MLSLADEDVAITLLELFCSTEEPQPSSSEGCTSEEEFSWKEAIKLVDKGGHLTLFLTPKFSLPHRPDTTACFETNFPRKLVSFQVNDLEEDENQKTFNLYTAPGSVVESYGAPFVKKII